MHFIAFHRIIFGGNYGGTTTLNEEYHLKSMYYDV